MSNHCAHSPPSLTEAPFGQLPDGRMVTQYTLDNGRGLRLSAINFGGIVTALEVPDRNGDGTSVVLGLPTLDDYVARNPHFGTIVGRYANRIAVGRFTLDGEAFQLPVNDGPNSLHGTVVLHVAPEAADGGPLAAVRDGDFIELDCAGGRLHLDISDDELAERLRSLPARPEGMAGGYQRLYVDHVLQADEGCDFDFLVGCRGSAVPRHSH